MNFIENAKLKMSVFLRERKERAAEKRAVKQAELPHHAAPALWVWFLATIAVCTLLGSSWMLAVFIAGSVGHVDWSFDWRAGNDGQPSRWVWQAEANLHALIGVGLALACIGVAMFNAVWLHVREHIRSVLFRRVITVIGVAVAFFMVSGAIVTQQWGTDARTRDEVIAAQTAQQGVAAIDAEIASIETEMNRLCADGLTTWQAQACRDGAIAWQRRIEITQQQNDANSRQRLLYMQSSLASAEQGDRWRARLLELRGQRARAAVTTVQAEAQDVRATGWFATFARVLEDIRKPFIAVLGELLAMTMFGVALEAHRSRQPYRVHPKASGWADDMHQIEDHSAEDPIAPQPMKPAREVVTDAETGEELVKIAPKPYWRKNKGKKQRVETAPDIPPDEVGVPVDGGGRTGSTAAGESVVNPPPEEVNDESANRAKDDGSGELGMVEDAPVKQNGQADETTGDQRSLDGGDLVHPEPPIEEAYTEEELAAITEADAPALDDEPTPESDQVAASEDQEENQITHEERSEPETNPARMIAAE